MIEIVPSILAQTSEDLIGLIKRYEPFFDRVSIDVSDGVFTTNKTVEGYKEIQKLDTNLAFDVHMMVALPQEKMPEWYKTKADRYFIHLDGNEPELERVIDEIRGRGKKVGLVANPATPTDKLLKYAHKIDLVQFMSVDPGFYGRGFIDEVVEKISHFKEHRPDKPIAVDGGINLETASKVVCAGADILVVGSYFLNSKNILKSLADLREVVNTKKTCLT